jgi:ferredoxin
MRVSVDRAKCTGHTRCNLLCPEVYVLDERGYNDVPDDYEVPPELEDAARRGAEACPEEAIAVEER